MALPRKLINFALFVDGVSYRGEVPEVKLPELSRKLEDYRAGGMDGEIALDMGQEKMEAEIKGAGFLDGLTAKWGSRRHDAVMLRFAGSLARDDEGGSQACEALMRGRLAKLDTGSQKAGDMTEQNYTYALSYYKLTVGGRVHFEIDLVNMICIVDGEDILANVRADLGI
jgi:P2 family phage contractile tail tube protein